MFARSSTFHGDRTGLDAGIDYVRNDVMALLEQVDGFVGLSLMVDRVSGECIATTSWRSEDTMNASSDRLAEVRERFGGMLHAPAKVQEWEVAVMRRADPRPVDRWCRATWLRTVPAKMDRAIDIYRRALLARIEQLPGFCSASLMVDRTSGRICATGSFNSLESLQLSRDEAWMIRESGIRESGVDIMDAAEYELAIAHLRVPELT